MIKETVKERRKRAKKLELTEREKVAERQRESEILVETWKIQKEEKFQKTKTLYTYNQREQQAVHEQAWRPARSVKYTYPKTKADRKAKPHTKASAEDDSYSLSFESEATDSEVSSQCSDSELEGSVSPVMESVSRAGSPSKGVRKSIQVCCQTLHYWCTCDQQHTHSS